MNIRIRKHNDMPNRAVVELIVDGEILDDQVCMARSTDVMQSIQELMMFNSPLKISYEDGIERRVDYNHDRSSHETINVVEPI